MSVVTDFLEAYFKEKRFDEHNHLGLGDIRLTFDHQIEIIEHVEYLEQFE